MNIWSISNTNLWLTILLKEILWQKVEDVANLVDLKGVWKIGWINSESMFYKDAINSDTMFDKRSVLKMASQPGTSLLLSRMKRHALANIKKGSQRSWNATSNVIKNKICSKNCWIPCIREILEKNHENCIFLKKLHKFQKKCHSIHPLSMLSIAAFVRPDRNNCLQ